MHTYTNIQLKIQSLHAVFFISETEEIPCLSLRQAPGSDGFLAKYYKIFKDILYLILLCTYNHDSSMKLFQIA